MFKKEKRDIELFIVDVLVSIQKIKEYTKIFSSAHEFQHSNLHWDATIRQLEIIGEALNNLLNDETFNSTAPKYFRKIVNFRNAIIHGYFGIDADEVWDIITSKLNILEVDINTIVEKNIDISDAVSSEIFEYKKTDDFHIVNYLTSLL